VSNEEERCAADIHEKIGYTSIATMTSSMVTMGDD
jgi:hypothetical protein